MREMTLTEKPLLGLYFIYKYRFLSISQFAHASGLSRHHAAEILRRLERLSAVGFFGNTPVAGAGRTPKVYYLRKKGYGFLSDETDFELDKFVEPNFELSWTPQMFHRLALLDLFIALEVAVKDNPHLELVKVFLEYRRVAPSYVRETSDYVSNEFVSDNRIVPDGAFILENVGNGQRGLFFVEIDTGSERITAPKSRDQRATIRGKLSQYDRYLASGRFYETYREYGEFRYFLMLFVTQSAERIANIREDAFAHLSSKLHVYYRFATVNAAREDFLGAIWASRSPLDTLRYGLVRLEDRGGDK